MKETLRGLGGPLAKLVIFVVVTLLATTILGLSIANYTRRRHRLQGALHRCHLAQCR